jgi:hypothetical protein
MTAGAFLLRYGSEFGLNNLTYPSFRCVTQYGITQLAAADLVTSVTAVLENFDAVASPEPGGGAITVEGSGSGAFSSGCAALRGTGLRDSAMRHGIERAKELLKATVQVRRDRVLTSSLGELYRGRRALLCSWATRS